MFSNDNRLVSGNKLSASGDLSIYIISLKVLVYWYMIFYIGPVI